MTRIANETGRRYRSQLRAQQAEATRVRILDAAVRVMAAGIADVSIPAVALEAGTSIPTIYRHFGTKRDLLAAVYPYLVRRTGLDEPVVPRSLEDLRDGVRAIFGQVDSFDDLARAAMASPGAEEARRINMPVRIAMIRRFVDVVVAEGPETDRDRIARLLVILTSTYALRTWRDYLGSSVDEAADDVDWVVRVALAAATRGKER